MLLLVTRQYASEAPREAGVVLFEGHSFFKALLKHVRYHMQRNQRIAT